MITALLLSVAQARLKGSITVPTSLLNAEVLRDVAYEQTHGMPVKKIGVMLPQASEVDMLSTMAADNLLTPTYFEQSHNDSVLEIHLLKASSYELFQPFDFDASSFTAEATDYARAVGLDGVLSFNCFPSLVASAHRQCGLGRLGRQRPGPRPRAKRALLGWLLLLVR